MKRSAELYNDRELSWLKHGVNNAKAVGLIPIWTIHLRVGLDDPSGPLPTQTFLCCYLTSRAALKFSYYYTVSASMHA